MQQVKQAVAIVVQNIASARIAERSLDVGMHFAKGQTKSADACATLHNMFATLCSTVQHDSVMAIASAEASAARENVTVGYLSCLLVLSSANSLGFNADSNWTSHHSCMQSHSDSIWQQCTSNHNVARERALRFIRKYQFLHGRIVGSARAGCDLQRSYCVEGSCNFDCLYCSRQACDSGYLKLGGNWHDLPCKINLQCAAQVETRTVALMLYMSLLTLSLKELRLPENHKVCYWPLAHLLHSCSLQPHQPTAATAY
jgi:hypothetical protein